MGLKTSVKIVMLHHKSTVVNKNKLAPYGTAGQLLLTANFKVM